MSELICEKTSGKDIDDIRSILPFPSMIILCGAISAKYRVNVSDEFDYQWSINSVIRDSGGSGSNPGLVPCIFYFTRIHTMQCTHNQLMQY